MPVWEFNRYQIQALSMLAMRRREAVELRTMALMMASGGHMDEAIDCLVKATALDNPMIAAETERFATDSADKFVIFNKQWKEMHGGGRAA